MQRARVPLLSALLALLAGCPSMGNPPPGGGGSDGGGGGGPDASPTVDLCQDITCGAGTFCDPGTGECGTTCTPDRTVGDFDFCFSRSNDGYLVVVDYTGQGDLDLAASDVSVNGVSFDASPDYDAATHSFTVTASGLDPSKYSLLFRMKTTGGTSVRPLFIPMWIGSGMRYPDFGWKDAIPWCPETRSRPLGGLAVVEA